MAHLGDLLREEGLEVFLASDHAGARRLLEETAGDPSILILDLADTEGVFGLLEGFRSSGAQRATRILGLLDADAAGALATRALEAGVHDFIRRPLVADVVRARLRSQLHTARQLKELQSEAEDLIQLLALTRRLASTLDVGSLLYDLVARLAESLGASRVSLVLIDESRRMGMVMAASDDQRIHDLEIALSDYPEIEEVLQRRLPLIVDEVAEHPVLLPVRERLIEKGIGSLALFPLVFEDQVTGVLFLRMERAHALTRRDRFFAEMVAEATAVALRNARLFEHMRDESKRVAAQRLRAERKIAGLERYADLYEHVREGILLIDEVGTIGSANPSARKILSAYGQLEGRRLPALGYENEDHDRLQILADSVSKGLAAGPIEVSVRGPGEEPRCLSVSGSPLSGGGAVLSFRDVTEERRVESELRTTTEFLQNLIDSSADAIVAADRRGRILLWNAAAERITGWRSEEVVGGKMHVSAIYPDDGAREVMRMLRGPEHGGPGRLESIRVDLLSKDGERIPVSLSAAVLREDGEEVATMGIFTDLRERLRIERKLSKAQDKLLRTEKQAMIAELAGTAAHELNQPLTSVMGYAELLKRRIPEDDPNHRAVDIIFRESERMAEIVRKIGRITRYETKTYIGNTRIVDLDRAVERPMGTGVILDEEEDELDDAEGTGTVTP
ncbi:MAG: PAS domain S-box protein [Deltaproteobacteria bacterium]|nr:MAG: PAS domain S-box protein [Deltaproteobacteria bacterium]